MEKEKLNVLVTGSSRGFGRLFVEALARKGHVVFATMRDVHGKNAEHAESLKEWARQNEAPVFVVEMDVSNENSVSEGVRHIIEEAGYIDVVINNAGVGSFGVNESFNMDEAANLFDINVLGTMRVNRTVLPYMRKRKKGLLIHISSVLGRTLIPFLGMYSASKYAMEAIAESYRYELMPLGIDSVIVEPAGYPTGFAKNLVSPINQNLSAEYGEYAVEGMKKLYENMNKISENSPDPKEVANLIVNLIETPMGKRPLRSAIGPGADNIKPLNKETDKIQSLMLEGLGFK